MALASTSKFEITYLEESTPGVTPNPGTQKRLRTTGESLGYKISAESSKEINASRQTADRIHVGATADGDLNIELSYKEYDPFLEALLCGTFSTFGAGGVTNLTVSFDHVANTITDDGADGFTGLVAGQWISVVGAAAAGNNGVFRIASRTNDQLTLDTDTPLAATASADAVSISSSRLSCGTAALRYFSLEKNFSDAGQFFMFRGMSPSKLALNFAAGSILNGSIGFMGFNSERSATTLMPGTAAAANGYGIMNSVVGVGQVLLDNAPIANTFIKTMSLNVDGKLRGQTAIGSLGNVGLGAGTFEIGGTLEMYLADGAIYDQALANTNVSIQFPVYDVAKNGYAFIFNNVKLDVPTVQASGMDADVMLSVPFNAVAPSSATDKMIIVDRFGASVA